jgi:tetratricopeptide (TPR) repeat protein
VGSTAYFAGRFAVALEEFERGLALDAHFTGTIDPHVGILSQAALSAWHLGRADLARKHAREACARAEALGRPADRAWACDFAAILHTVLREPEAVQRHAEAVLSACAEAPNPLHEAEATLWRGWALAQQGHVSEGLALMRTGLESRPTIILGGLLLDCLGEVLIDAGDFAAAREALDATDATLDAAFRAETARLRGELLARTGADAAGIEAAYRGALATAARQGTLALELRAGTSFARWLRGQGRSAEARALLAPVYVRFTEGFDTLDLIEAKALLGELGA